MRETYYIVCPGPSAQSGYIFPDPCSVIAVNGAILYDNRYDWWIVQDFEVFESVYQKWQGVKKIDPILWVPDRWLSDLKKYDSKKQDFFDLFSKLYFSSATQAAFNNSMPFGKNINWREYTVFMAIAFAIKAGADKICILGADMKAGYTQPDMDNSRVVHSARRWKDEAGKLEKIIHLSAQHGIAIVREVNG